MPGLPEHGEGAVAQLEDDRAGVDVVVALEDREAPDGARGVQLSDLLAGHPAERVEVVDRGVAEEPSGDRDVGIRGRLVVVGDEADQVDGAQFTALHHPAGLPVGRVEPALEADLDGRSCRLDLVDQSDGLVEVEGERLLAEDRQAPVHGHRHEPSVGVGRGGHEHGVGRVESLLGTRGHAASDRFRGLPGAGRVDVGDDQLYVRLSRDQPTVELPDPAGADECDLHFPLRLGTPTLVRPQWSGGRGR